jgi:hypothetical protein
LKGLSAQLGKQKAIGSNYLVGDKLSACDLYWACFSQMLQPLPHEACPMPDMVRASYSAVPPEVAAALDPALIKHRDMVYERYIGLPLDF